MRFSPWPFRFLPNGQCPIAHPHLRRSPPITIKDKFSPSFVCTFNIVYNPDQTKPDGFIRGTSEFTTMVASPFPGILQLEKTASSQWNGLYMRRRFLSPKVSLQSCVTCWRLQVKTASWKLSTLVWMCVQIHNATLREQHYKSRWRVAYAWKT